MLRAVPYVSPYRDTPITDLLHARTGGDIHGTRPGSHPGGEWDPWRALTPRQRRRLIGARYAHPTGLAPDRLATIIASNGGPQDPRDAIHWYLCTALRAIQEQRTARTWERRHRLATKHGHPHYYAYRTAQARLHGHATLWTHRTARGWK